MQDNYNYDITETLLKYLDGELNATEKQAMEKELQTDTNLQERYQHLLIAKQAIRSQGLKQRVQQVHNEYMQELQHEKTAKIVKSSSYFKIFMRVAAVFFIAIAGYAVFLYSSTTNEAEYSKNFIAYHAPVSRGNENTSNLNALYNTGNYNEIIKSFLNIKNKNQQDYFIAAQAYLQLNNTTSAINTFKELENMNNKSSEKFFEQETDYYLMMTYIKSGQIDLAERELNKITNNKQHLFYNKAKNISRTKLEILKWKNK